MRKKAELLHIIKDNAGITIVEVIISLVILSIALIPFLNMFAVSADNNNRSGECMKTAYIAQQRIEEIKGMDYITALKEGNGVKKEYEGYFVEVVNSPYYTTPGSKLQVIIKENTLNNEEYDIYFVPSLTANIIAAEKLCTSTDIDFRILDGSYLININEFEKSDLIEENQQVEVIINMLKYNATYPININISADKPNLKAVVYDTKANHYLLNINGIQPVYHNNCFYKQHLPVRTVVKVFRNRLDTIPKNIIDAIIELEI